MSKASGPNKATDTNLQLRASFTNLDQVSDGIRKLYVQEENKFTIDLTEENGKIYLKLTETDPYKIGSKLAQALQKIKADSFLCIIEGLSDQEILAAAEACILRYQKFDKYLSEKKNSKKSVHFLVKDISIAKEFTKTERICSAIIRNRDLVNLPPNHLKPSDLVEHALKLKDLGVKVEVLEGDKIEKMGLLVAVGKGSSDPAKLIVCEFGEGKDTPICLVGKGVTFDSGGYSIKTPSNYMEKMKDDMAGAATVLAIIESCAQIGINGRLVGIIPCVENMISGNAMVPGDIYKSFDGTSVEVRNTDAEGRLILADAISYAKERYSPETLIDFATLTGAIVVALGKRSGIFSNSDKLWNELSEHIGQSGEYAWRMPLGDEYMENMKGKISDLQNISSVGGEGSSCTAAEFLNWFVKKGKPISEWAHCDIAGSAFIEKGQVFSDIGGTMALVRGMVQWIKSRS